MNKISLSEAQKAINLEVAKAGCNDNEQCLCYDSVDFETHDLVANMVDDTEKPIFETSEVILEEIIINECDKDENGEVIDIECEDEVSQLMSCQDEFDLIESQCKKLIGYELKQDGYKFQLNEQKQTDLIAKRQAEKAQSEAMAMIAKRRAQGEEIINLMILRNAQKNLNAGQKKQVLQAYHDIKELLSVGNLEQAKLEIQGASIDNIMVTDSDKQSLIKAIDERIK
jgi:uncharacterized protein YuzE